MSAETSTVDLETNDMMEELSDNETSETKVHEDEDLTHDGGVIKKIIKEGEGWKTPEKGYEVKVHYVGKLLDGTLFDSSRERNEEFQFKLGEGQVIKGWDKGVASMKKGEIALLTCKPEYAYGAGGHPPKIPPNATLQFEVELLGWIEEKDVTEKRDGGVTKKILKEGEGWENPKEDCRVKVNYKASLLDGTIKDEKNDVEFICGEEENVILGLDLAVRSMKKGEKALVTIKSDYHKGASFQAPEGQDVKYEVELVEFDKEKSTWDMNFEEKLEVAQKRKGEGNQLYSAQKYTRAIKKYKKALDIFSYDGNLKDEEKNKVKEVKISCHLNTAMSLMKTNKFKEAVDDITKVLELDKTNVKALFRRGTCYTELDEWDNAQKDLNKALELDPENKDVKKQLIILKNKIKEQNKKDKKIFGGMFERFAKNDLEKEKKKMKPVATEQIKPQEEPKPEPMLVEVNN